MGTPRLPLIVIALIATLACLPAVAQVVTSTIGMQVNPASAAVNTVTNTIYVANKCGNDNTCSQGGGSVTILNGTTLTTQNVQVGAYPYPIKVDTSLNQIYTATCNADPTCGSPGTVTVINGATLDTTSIPTGYFTDWVTVNPVTHNVYAVNECNDSACASDGTVTVFSGSNLSAPPQTINLSQGGAWSAVVNTQTNTIYAVNRCGNYFLCNGESPGSVTVINGSNNSVVATVSVGFYPQFAAVDEVHNLIYVVNNGGADGSGIPGAVSVINGATNTVETTINVGDFPSPVVFNPNTNMIYVGNSCSESTCTAPPSVSVINGSTMAVTATVPICRVDDYPAVDSEIDLTTNKIYFPCQQRSTTLSQPSGLTVSVLDGATNTTTPIAVGDFPNAAVVNSVTNQIYVPNQEDYQTTNGTVSVIGGNTKLQLVNVTPCRLVDTRQTGGPIQGGSSRNFSIPQFGGCNIPATAVAYSLNVTVVPPNGGTLGYLSIWPTPENQPTVSTLNSPDGRTKANAAVVSAGVGGTVSVYVSDTTNVILDIAGYFAPATSQNYQFYSLPPCRLVDTRGADGELGGPHLKAQTPRSFPLLTSSCIPSGLNPNAYSLNFTVIPNPSGQPLSYLTVWPTGEKQPVVSTLNNPTATVVANAAIVPAGTGGAIDVYATNTTDLLIDIDGYFAPPGTGGLSMYPAPPCRVLDTRSQGAGSFTGEKTVNVVGSGCAPPSNAAAYILNATVVPPGSMPYLTLWPDGEQQPVVSTLNAYDGFITSNMAIVPTNNGSIDAYAAGLTQLILDISGYFAP
jgi:YVTN family beta-propeller protein